MAVASYMTSHSGTLLGLGTREALVKHVGSPSAAEAVLFLWHLTDGLKAVPFKKAELIRPSLAARGASLDS